MSGPFGVTPGGHAAALAAPPQWGPPTYAPRSHRPSGKRPHGGGRRGGRGRYAGAGGELRGTLPVRAGGTLLIRNEAGPALRTGDGWTRWPRPLRRQARKREG